jgi:hypothetical protein
MFHQGFFVDRTWAKVWKSWTKRGALKVVCFRFDHRPSGSIDLKSGLATLDTPPFAVGLQRMGHTTRTPGPALYSSM